MSYQVLARKWRPANFEELVGQKQTSKALSNALESQRLHHAYLFTGTRGVGKTTIARILAKSLNCDRGITSKPCGECASCTEISQGNFVDLLEIDAASKTKVEDTRELLDNVQYRPTKGRYKVYLIDEVHMLSGHSFNALLKTLEEPPPHVIFLLATTDPQKMPVTVLSRCLQFHLRRMDEKEIVNHLSMILEKESICFEPSALDYIAKGADGSMRDALSLMDQSIAFCGEEVTAQQVLDMLGTIDRAYAIKLLKAVISGDAENLMNSIEEISEFAPDFDELLGDWLALLHQIAVSQATGKAEDSSITDLIELCSAAEIQLYYQLSLQARKDLAYAPTPKQGFEMAMLRVLAFKPDGMSTPPLKKKSNLVTNDESNIQHDSQQQVSPQSSEALQNRETIEENSFVKNDILVGEKTEAKSLEENALVVSQAAIVSEQNLYQSQSIPQHKNTTGESEFSSTNPESYSSHKLEDTAPKKTALKIVIDNEKSIDSVSEPTREKINTEPEKGTAADKVRTIIEQAEKNESPVLNKEPATKVKVDKKSRKKAWLEGLVQIPFAEVAMNNWFNVVFALPLDGNGMQVLLNSLAAANGNKLKISIQKKSEPLLTTSAKSLIIDSLKKYFSLEELLVDLDFIEDESQIFENYELPRARQSRLFELAIDDAEQTLREDSQVGYLIERLDATLPRKSIKLI